MINSRYLRMATALRLARPMIESGQERFICRALYIISRQYPLLRSAIAWAKVWIADMLYPHGAYESWAWDIGHYPTSDEARLARLAWIDWMVEELEKE